MQGISDQRLPRNFIKTTISARLKCPICFQVYFKPRRLYCGHTFCKPCLHELTNKQHHKNPEHVNTCPLCRTAIEPNYIAYDFFAIRVINELQVSCPVYGCPWKGENQLLETHYRYDCKMKGYVKKLAKGSKDFNFEAEEHQEKDNDIAQKLNENIQKGSLISRVISKNPHLLNPVIEAKRPEKNNETIRRPKLTTCGTQTYPVKIIPISRVQRRNNVQKPVFISPPMKSNIVPMNGFDQIPSYLLKSKPKNLATRIKHQNKMSSASSSEEIRGIRQLYNDMGLNFCEDEEFTEISNRSGALDIDQ